MTNAFEDDKTEYVAVVNHEGQYSIWPASRDLPLGWTDAGARGTRRDCLAWIEEHWTDMRPRSLVEAMENAQ